MNKELDGVIEQYVCNACRNSDDCSLSAFCAEFYSFKKALIPIIEKGIVGEDETIMVKGDYMGFGAMKAISRNKFRAEQRKKLKDLVDKG